ncbi:T9SS type B sorting domain-containing protein [Sediminicola luteus]|uniref:Ig-like domain-containing protein n=1 Tax=Sediminicola luteus TaxID=319238 RepID=A0A2A4G8B7_9FLAO|nr:choice-of-anchor L domain-containing protein [Sediminicola luteus]PCE63995.1 hypothetical protein B7P33_12145 [Sediminicola luteus]
MEIRKIKWSLGLILGILPFALTAQIRVDDTSYTVEQLVEDVLVFSNCASTSNWNKSAGESGGFNGVGYFDARGTSFPFEEGIVISTGNARSAEGPNTNELSDGTENNLWGGDADLAAITNTSQLFNASFIEFDFVPLTDTFSFNFIFASEEYTGFYPCEFSDVFAFILTRPDGTTENLAQLPNSNVPIRVTSIHPAIDFEGQSCPAVNEEYFDGYNPSNAPIDFNGQTVTFTAGAQVVPGETYGIKLVIADNRDGYLDSAVFLEAGSFDTGVDLGLDRTIAENGPVCSDYLLTANVPGNPTYSWFRDGNLLVGETGPDYLATASGTYRVNVDLGNGCVMEDEVLLEFVPPSLIGLQPLDLARCELDGNTMELFDLTENSSDIIGGLDPDIYRLSFHLSQEDADSGENPIAGPTSYEGTDQQRIYARLAASIDCFDTTSFLLEVNDFGTLEELEETYYLCVDENGITLSSIPIDINMDPATYYFQWFRGTDVASGIAIPGASNPTYAASEIGAYTVAVTHIVYGCTYERSTEVIAVSPPTSFDVRQTSERFTQEAQIEVNVTGDSTYQYAMDDGAFQESNVFENVAPGRHIFYVQDVQGCHVYSQGYTVVDFPRFFSPNNDTANNSWGLIGPDTFNNYTIFIFDRYGKLLTQLNSSNPEWDGTFNGRPLPADDYWFRLVYLDEDNTFGEYKGHMALVR